MERSPATNPPRRIRLAVLASGSGSNLQAILERTIVPASQIEIAVVLTNRPRSGALVRAKRAGIDTVCISHRHRDRDDFENEAICEIRTRDVQWVVLAGFMRILGPNFLAAFPDRVINIHPSLLPSFPGINAQSQAFAAGVAVSGCTVHFVNQSVDTGAIIAQRAVAVLPDDSAELLRKRILSAEHVLYPTVLEAIASEKIKRPGDRLPGTWHSGS